MDLLQRLLIVLAEGREDLSSNDDNVKFHLGLMIGAGLEQYLHKVQVASCLKKRSGTSGNTCRKNFLSASELDTYLSTTQLILSEKPSMGP